MLLLIPRASRKRIYLSCEFGCIQSHSNTTCESFPLPFHTRRMPDTLGILPHKALRSQATCSGLKSPSTALGTIRDFYSWYEIPSPCASLTAFSIPFFHPVILFCRPCFLFSYLASPCCCTGLYIFHR